VQILMVMVWRISILGSKERIKGKLYKQHPVGSFMEKSLKAYLRPQTGRTWGPFFLMPIMTESSGLICGFCGNEFELDTENYQEQVVNINDGEGNFQLSIGNGLPQINTSGHGFKVAEL